MADNNSDLNISGTLAEPDDDCSDDNASLEARTEDIPFDTSLECPLSLKARGENLEEVCKLISRHKWNVGTFQADLFAHTKKNDPRNTPVRTAMVAAHLGGRTKVHAGHTMKLQLTHPYSKPKAVRKSKNRDASAVKRPDETKMARWHMREVAIEEVVDIVDKEAEKTASKEGGFHLETKKRSWAFVYAFTMSYMLKLTERSAPTILRLIVAVAFGKKKRPQPEILEDGSRTYAAYVTDDRPLEGGKGKNRHDPWMVILTVIMMLMNVRNLHANLFQYIISVWLFSNAVAVETYVIFNRLGISVAYTSVLDFLHTLSSKTREDLQKSAVGRLWLLIYDNINRMFRPGDPDIGDKDTMHCGTAGTKVEIEDCEAEKALDPEPLHKAQAEGRRKALSLDTLLKKLDHEKMSSIFELHILSFLIENVELLAHHQELVTLRLRTTHAVHRMRDGRKTKLSPLATSDLNSGNTAETAKVLDDYILDQMNLPKDKVDKFLCIVGGDQSSVEKLRTLKKFVDDCPHGYARYGWVVPLIQLWHMGWADLERVLKAHWGHSTADDLSSYRSTNVLLDRKVKNVKRPDYYPAQHLVVDTLKADVLSAWKTHLGTSSLDSYFEDHDLDFEDLLAHAKTIGQRYTTATAYEVALQGGAAAREFFPVGNPWNGKLMTTAESMPDAWQAGGDTALANTILRMRDSMLHYEFQWAIADGDIGRAMNVMSFWTFTFQGAGKSKYANELLELTCNFEFEYSDALQEAILNNWLCNLTGYLGGWFPMDLLQEKNIKQLKEMAQRKNATFGGEFFRQVVSLNIRAFLEVRKSLRSAVGLNARSEKHRRKKKVAALRKLADEMETQGLHTFRAGRYLGHVASDNFTKGLTTFAKGNRIRDFIKRTLFDGGVGKGEGQGDSEDENEDDEDEGGGERAGVSDDATDSGMSMRVVLPSIIAEGTLVLGDEGFYLDGQEETGEVAQNTCA